MPDYCTTDDVKHILTTEGVDWLTIDQEIDAEDVLAKNIERATVRIDQYVSGKYEPSVLASNMWVKWAAAVIASRYIAMRGGNPVPTGIQQQYDENEAFLKDVAAGVADIPGASRPRVGGIAMSNMVVDSRYPERKLRVLSGISVGDSQSDTPRNLSEVLYG